MSDDKREILRKFLTDITKAGWMDFRGSFTHVVYNRTLTNTLDKIGIKYTEKEYNGHTEIGVEYKEVEMHYIIDQREGKINSILNE